MEIEKQTFRLPGQGVLLAVFLSVNNKVHVVAFRWVKSLFTVNRWEMSIWNSCGAQTLEI